MVGPIVNSAGELSDLHAQVAATTQRLNDLLDAFQRVDRDLVAMGEQFAAGFGRLDSDVVVGFATQVAALQSTAEELRPSIQQLAPAFGHLDKSIGVALASQRDGLSSVADRLQASIEALQATIQDLGAGFSRLDHSIGAAFIAQGEAFIAGNSSLQASLDQVKEGFSRLDGDVIGGFGEQIRALGAIPGHLQPSITQLSEAFGRLDRNVGDAFTGQALASAATSEALQKTLTDLVLGFGRIDAGQNAGFADLASALARLEANIQLQSGKAANSLDRTSLQEPRVSAASAPTSSENLFRDKVSATTINVLMRRKSLGQWLTSGPYVVLDQSAARASVEETTSTLAAFVGCRRSIPAKTRLLWLLGNNEKKVTIEEASQVFGILADPDVVESVELDGKLALVVAGARRTENVLAFLRWTSRNVKDAQVVASSEEKFSLSREAREALVPVIDIPQDFAQADATWAWEVARAIKRVHGAKIPAYGVTWSLSALSEPNFFAAALDTLASALRPLGCALLAQWVREPVSVDRSTQVLEIAERFGIRLDLTPLTRASGAGMPFAYDDLLLYRPMCFDIRIPGHDAGVSTCALARRPVRTNLAEFDLDDQHALSRCFERRAEDISHRLQQVLDRDSVERFGAITNDDPWAQSGVWEQYHVFNWAPPLRQWFAAMVFDAIELKMAASPLQRIDAAGAFGDQSVLKTVDISSALDQSIVGGDETRATDLDFQIREHTYLVNRREPSADSARLASWLPNRLGHTLEIGCGYGVLAKTFIQKTDGYVGLDLTVKQGEAIIDLGGAAVIADFQDLPFATKSFDTVVADNAIEHAMDPVRALREISRVLREGGSAYLALPFDFLGPKYQNSCHHWKADEASVRSAAAAAGLRVVRFESCLLSTLGVQGSFPSCAQTTSLWHLTLPTESRDDADVKRRRRSRTLDVKSELQALAPAIARAADEVTERIVNLNRNADFAPLERRSPGLKNFDWSAYLRLSELRVVRALHHLERRDAGGQALDVGAYFGNTALTLAHRGWNVTAIDSYSVYRPAFDRHLELMSSVGVTKIDFDDAGFDLAGLAAESFDAVLCMGVIEHIAHTPRPLMQALRRVLKRGGWLVLDTPNLAYQHQRNKLGRGESVFPPVEVQFDAVIPFEGHHREYTPNEVQWMLSRIGQVDIEIEMFNYSIYGLTTLAGADLEMFEQMERDPTRRELIMAVSRKP